MSDNPDAHAGCSDRQTNKSPPNKTPDSTQADKNNVIAFASKQINDVIQFQEPSTSKQYSFKTEIRINILGEPQISQNSLDTNNSVCLSLFNENVKKEPVEVQESFVTMDTCIKEKTTSTNEPTMFSRNDRTQRAIVVNSEAPPPYDSHPPPAYSTMPTSHPYGQQTTTGGSASGYYPYGYDSPSFLDIQIRHFFVKKVFFILSVQLMITAAFILLVMFHQPSKRFVATNLPMFFIMSALQLILFITLMCYEVTRRIFPLNFILLLVFTIAMSYICAAATILYSTKIILMTVVSTALICLIVTLLACQTWFDITKWSFIIAIASVVVAVFGLVVIIVSLITHSPVLWLVFAGLATVLFTVFLLYDMQCILGGRRHELSPEEYIYGALTLYVDIVMIFVYMLQLINACSS